MPEWTSEYTKTRDWREPSFRLNGRVARYNPNPTIEIASSLDLTAGNLTGDVDPLTARGLGPGFLV